MCAPHIARGRAWLALAIVSTCSSNAARAQWTEIAAGLDYAEMSAPGPNRAFVARMHRDDPTLSIDTAIARGSLRGGTETVSEMASRYDRTLGWWGESWGSQEQVVAAINGSFFDVATGVAESGTIAGGWYAARFGEFSPSGFAWNLDREAFIGGCVRHRRDDNFVRLPDGTTHTIDAINAPDTGELVVYTHQWGPLTPASNMVEARIAMQRPALVLPSPAAAEGTVVSVKLAGGSSELAFDEVVLSGSGAAATELRALHAGDTVGITQEITALTDDCSRAAPFDWTKTYASLGGSFHFLRAGAIATFTDAGANIRNPRTAIALSDAFVFFVVVDGRSTASVGMTMNELGTFCRDALGASEGINQDGGGSSALWVDGTVRNRPSDGVERPVANAFLIVRELAAERSSVFGPGDVVRATSSAPVRLGPGDNFESPATLAAGAEVTVRDHAAAGVRARDRFWWRVDGQGASGWVEEDMLELVHAAPRDVGVGTESRDGGATRGPESRADGGRETLALTAAGWACHASVLPPIRPLRLGWLGGWLALPLALRRRRRRRRMRSTAAVASIASALLALVFVSGCAAGECTDVCPRSAVCMGGRCVGSSSDGGGRSGDGAASGVVDGGGRRDAIAADAPAHDGPFLCGEVSLALTETQESIAVPADVLFMLVKAWGAGGNDERGCGPTPDGGIGGFTAASFRVTPGESLVAIVGQRGRAGVTGEAPYRFGFGAWGGGGLTGVFRAPAPIEEGDRDRALVIAGGGGSAGAGDCSPGGVGNHPEAGGATTMMGGFATDGSVVGGGGGYVGGTAGSNSVAAHGGTAYVAPEALHSEILYADPGSNVAPRADDPDYVPDTVTSEMSGHLVIRFLCDEPPPDLI